MNERAGTAEVAFSFGSNVGDKVGLIMRAAALLRAGDGVPDLQLSSLYRTKPWGHVVDQDWFVNACGIGHTGLDPEQLLARCQDIERQLGRQATVRWGPRLIDIDLLFYEDAVRVSSHLTIPHREMMRRAFVLVPLAELAPLREIDGQTVLEAAARLDRSGIERMSGDGPEPTMGGDLG